jgi:hypothetical protein
MSEVTRRAKKREWETIAYRPRVTDVTTKVTACPTCGHPIPHDDIAGSFPPTRRKIYELIREAGTNGIRRVGLEQLLYADARGGGPETNTISVQLSQGINPVLKTHGLIIRSRHHRYRLEKLDEV